jgi:hypothetical protein
MLRDNLLLGNAAAAERGHTACDGDRADDTLGAVLGDRPARASVFDRLPPPL